jgi:hypothetical protein
MTNCLAEAVELRKAQPHHSEAQAFSKVFTDLRNKKLSARPHRRPAATKSFPFPRHTQSRVSSPLFSGPALQRFEPVGSGRRGAILLCFIIVLM